MVDGLWMEFPPTDPRYNAFEYRRFLHMLTGGREGVWPASTGLNVTQRGSGVNMSVDVATGSAIVASTESTRESYQATFPSITNLVVPAAHASSITKHLVVVRFQNALEFSGSVNTTTVELLAGTSGANTDPTLTANSYILARVTVPGGATSVTNAMITDLRKLFALSGGVIVCTSTTRPTGVVEGQLIGETNTSRFYEWDGSAWIYQFGGIQPLYAARLFIASPYTSPHAAEKIIPYDTVGHDFNGDTTLGASAGYDVPVSGLYDIRANVTFGYNNARQIGTLLIRADSSEKSRISNSWGSGLTTNDPCGLQLAEQVALVAGEFVTARFTGSGSSSNSVQVTDSFFQIRRV